MNIQDKEAITIIEELMAYGNIRPVDGVRYTAGTHRDMLERASQWLNKARNDYPAQSQTTQAKKEPTKPEGDLVDEMSDAIYKLVCVDKPKRIKADIYIAGWMEAAKACADIAQSHCAQLMQEHAEGFAEWLHVNMYARYTDGSSIDFWATVTDISARHSLDSIYTLYLKSLKD